VFSNTIEQRFRTSDLEPMTVEPMTGIEPAYSAWEAVSRPEWVSETAS